MKRKLCVLLAGVMACMLLAGCGGNKEEASQPESPASSVQDSVQASSAAEASQAEAPADSKLHITVQTVSISLAELKAQDYTVPVLVTIDRNPGLQYTEWGLHVDPKCTFKASKDNADVPTVFAENEEQHFIWTAWAGDFAETGVLLEVALTLPQDAAAGSMYTLSYADISLADKPHVWNSGSEDYAASAGAVTWTDGGVKVTD